MTSRDERTETEGEDVPWPDEWPEESRRLVVVGILALTAAVGVAAFLCYKRWDAESYGQSIAAGFLAVVGAAWLRFAVVSKLRDRWKPLEKVTTEQISELDESGVVLHYAPAMFRVYWTSLVLLIALSAAISAGLIALGIQDDFSLWIYLEIVVMILLTLYGIRFLVEFIRRQVHPGLVAITPRGVYHRSWTFSGFMPWEHVESVTAVDVQGPVVLVSCTEDTFMTPINQTSKLWRQGELELVPDLAIRGRWTAVDAAVVYHALRWYHLNPAARAELGTDQGAARVRAQKIHTEAPKKAEQPATPDGDAAS